ncbi:GntR family transcriptional regulator [Frankia gtarii]|uniref:GntR family transcriptional regulator n=1 Tax=Frankia gtarii TaxID=2950102 RepID=UPI0021BFDD72|nr:GntR family transcriptional regulator [Frankia gtarii]
MTAPKLPAWTGRSRHRRPRLSDEVATHVRELIISGRLGGGEFIRPEAVAEDLGISATPAREGLLQLQSKGFLQVEPRRGFVVSPLSPKDIRDTFEAQALLGGELCARAADLVTSADVRALQEIQTRLERAAETGDLTGVEELNFEFHRMINRIADAPKIRWLLGSTLSYAPRRFFPSIRGWSAASARDHRAILRALRDSDGDAARAAMTDHIRRAGTLLTEHLAQETGRSTEPDGC